MTPTTTKKKFPRAQAIQVAREIVDALKPACVQIQTAGSLRRYKPFVSDIEILFVPKVEEQKDLLGFSDGERDLAEDVIKGLLANATLAMRANTAGHFTWGPQNKLAVHQATGIPIDLFKTSMENWWTALVIRTGSKETNLRLTTGAQRLGRKLHAYGSGVSMPDGSLIRAESEAHVFELCGLQYVSPDRR